MGASGAEETLTRAPRPQVISPFHIYFNARLIWKKMELWRLLSNFCYFGPMSECCGAAWRPHCAAAPCAWPSCTRRFPPCRAPHPRRQPARPQPPLAAAGIDFFFHIYFLIKYSKSLEEGSFRNRSADFLWMLLFGGVLLTAMAPFVNVQFLGSALTFMMVRARGECGAWGD